MVLLQGLGHIQQAQSRCVVSVPDHRPGPHHASAGSGPHPTPWPYSFIYLISLYPLAPHTPLTIPLSSPVGPSPHNDHAYRSLVLTRSALASILAPASPMALPLISSAVSFGLVLKARSRTLAPCFNRDSATDRDCKGWD